MSPHPTGGPTGPSRLHFRSSRTAATAPVAEVTRLTADRVADAAATLTASHADYPAFAAVFPQRAQRTRALRPFFEATISDAVRHGVVDGIVENEQLSGVAVWLPPGGFPWSPTRKVRAMPTLLRVAAATPRSFPRFARIGTNTERLQPSATGWYLVVLGVRPSTQRSGIGSRLLRAGLQRADADGIACDLQTSDPDNVAFYERFGFHVTDPAVPLVPDGPMHTAMRRPEGGR